MSWKEKRLKSSKTLPRPSSGDKIREKMVANLLPRDSLMVTREEVIKMALRLDDKGTEESFPKKPKQHPMQENVKRRKNKSTCRPTRGQQASKPVTTTTGGGGNCLVPHNPDFVPQVSTHFLAATKQAAVNIALNGNCSAPVDDDKSKYRDFRVSDQAATDAAVEDQCSPSTSSTQSNPRSQRAGAYHRRPGETEERRNTFRPDQLKVQHLGLETTIAGATLDKKFHSTVTTPSNELEEAMPPFEITTTRVTQDENYHSSVGAQELSTLYTDDAQTSSGDTSLVKGRQNLDWGAVAVAARPGGERDSMVPFGALPDIESALSEEQESNQNNNLVEAELMNGTVHTATKVTESEREVGAQWRAMDESSVDSRNQSTVVDTKALSPIEQEDQPEEKRYTDPWLRCLLGLAAFAILLIGAVLGAVIWSSSQDKIGFEPEEDATDVMASPSSPSKDYQITVSPTTNPTDAITSPEDEFVNGNQIESEQDGTQTAANPGPQNDKCENAKPLPLDPDILQIKVAVNSFSLTADPEVVSSECNYYGGGFDHRPGVWYSLVGNGRIYKIEVDGNEGPSVAIYDGVIGCHSLECNFYDQSEESHWYYDGVILPTKEGEDYLIFVYHSKGEVANTVLTISQDLG